MRHRVSGVRLGRKSVHLRQLIGSLVGGLIRERKIRTTVSKAKAARRLADKMIGLAKRGTVVARRRAAATVGPKEVRILFDELGPLCKNRSSGYTRIVRLGTRAGDNAEMAILEWVDAVVPRKKKRKKKEKPDKAEEQSGT